MSLIKEMGYVVLIHFIDGKRGSISMIMNRLRIIFLVICLFCILLPQQLYAEPQIKAYHVKARYIEGFTSFIHWPEEIFTNSDQPMQLCVLGDNPFNKALDILVRKHNTRKNRHSQLQAVNYLHRGDDITACHLLYIGESEEGFFYQLLKQTKGRSILTISSIEDFVINGGMIQFYILENKVHFLMDVQTIRDENLNPNANLLRVAEFMNKKVRKQ